MKRVQEYLQEYILTGKLQEYIAEMYCLFYRGYVIVC